VQALLAVAKVPHGSQRLNPGNSALPPKARNPRYEMNMVAILSLIFGLITFEQVTVFYLEPFIQPDLKLSNTQVGLLGSVYWGTLAVSSYGISAVADLARRPKIYLRIAIILMSTCSVLSGLATSFPALLTARAVMGGLEGPMSSIVFSIVALESSAARLGTNMGVVANLGSGVLQGFAAPIVLVATAQHYGWRVGFFFVVLPGLICAILAGWVFKAAPVIEARPRDAGVSTSDICAPSKPSRTHRNVWLCVLIFVGFMAYASIAFAFLPLYFVNVRHFSAQQMSFIMSLLGSSVIPFGILLPMVSDHFGRKPVVIVASLSGVVCPLASLYYFGPIPMLIFLLFIGFAWGGIYSLVTGTIPSETVPARILSRTMGRIFAIGTLGGGFLGPTIGGWSADHWGLRAPLLLQATCAFIMTLAALGLRESAPRVARSVVIP